MTYHVFDTALHKVPFRRASTARSASERASVSSVGRTGHRASSLHSVLSSEELAEV